MNYLFDPLDELVTQLREWCKNNPLDVSEHGQEKVSSWNKGIPHLDETKKSISESNKGHTRNNGRKAPWSGENWKKAKYRAYGHYEVITPTGEKIKVSYLKQYCEKNNLNYTSMSSLANGKWPCSTYRGYSCKKIGYIKNHREPQLSF